MHNDLIAKRKVKNLQGKPLRIKINQGRNHFDTFSGEITEVYANVFVVVRDGKKSDFFTCTYSDVICGDILFSPLS